MDDLDRLIDEAARRMAQGEPSDALSSAVMERVATGPTTLLPRRWRLGTAAAAIAMAAVVVLVVEQHRAVDVHRQAQGSGLKAQGAGVEAQGSGLKAQGAEPNETFHPAQLRRSPGMTATDQPIDLQEPEPIRDPIVFDTISPEPLRMDRLQVEASAPVEPIKIEPIEIAPISLSND